MSASERLHAVILAGGAGTRLWPRSRRRHPKQFLDLTGDGTMLEESVSRIAPIIPSERIFVVTGQEYVPEVFAQLPALPRENVIGEPTGRGTAPAIGLAALHLSRRDPNSIMAVLTADHIIAHTATFRNALLAAAEWAVRGYLVTLGIRAARPETGYGYIERGEFLGETGGFQAYHVARFTEKPDEKTAHAFVESGRYAWNSGMFIWRVDRIMEQIERLMPDLAAALAKINSVLGTPAEAERLAHIWPAIRSQTIDYGVMERAENVVVLPVDIGWNDVGTWAALHLELPADEAGNVVQGQHLALDTQGTFVYSPHRLVATIGLKDMIIVDTEDALLICPRSRAQDVKGLVELLEKKG
ncbi:MAG TPA: mannose-1-phosphate guanylyltransferase, partial [Anaerolineae bacterium]|nr:mannose-1-phosphate guanylyltransferase [Anaerolineae bacterium]